MNCGNGMSQTVEPFATCISSYGSEEVTTKKDDAWLIITGSGVQGYTVVLSLARVRMKDAGHKLHVCLTVTRRQLRDEYTKSMGTQVHNMSEQP